MRIPPSLKDEHIKRLLGSENENIQEFLKILIAKLTNVQNDVLQFISPYISNSDTLVNSEADIVYANQDAYFNIEVNTSYHENSNEKNNFYIFLLKTRDCLTYKDYSKSKHVYQINLNYYDYYQKGQKVYHSTELEDKYYLLGKMEFDKYQVSMDIIEKVDYNDIERYSLDYYLYLFLGTEEQLKKLYKGDELMEKVAEMNFDLQREFDKLFLYDKGKLDREIAYDQGVDDGRTELLAKTRQTLRARGMSPEEINEIERILNAPDEEQVTRKRSKKTKVSSAS